MAELEQIDQRQGVARSTALDTAKDIVAGAAGGIAQVLIGQPFDLVKVRLQTSSHGTMFSVAHDVALKEGLLAFYKGSLMPLLGIGACVSIQFGAFHAVRKSFESRNARNFGPATPDLSLTQYYLAGAIAGIANSVIANPVEHIRIRLQTQPHGANRIYTGPTDCLRQTVGQYGIKGLFRGNVACLIREFHGFGLWFVTYEALLNYDMTSNSRSRNEVPLLNIALYGGLGGQALWLGTYPIDVVKSRMQNDGFGGEQRYHNLREAVASTWRELGIRGFFRGIGPTLARTMFTSAATFVTAEKVKEALN